MMLKTNEDLVDTVCDMVRYHMRMVEERRGTEMNEKNWEPVDIDVHHTIDETVEQIKEQLRIESKTEANVDETHESRLRHMIAIMDEEDAKTVLDVLVIKHPFTVIDVLKDYFLKMDADIKNMRKVFTIREAKENDICGGNE